MVPAWEKRGSQHPVILIGGIQCQSSPQLLLHNAVPFQSQRLRAARTQLWRLGASSLPDALPSRQWAELPILLPLLLPTHCCPHHLHTHTIALLSQSRRVVAFTLPSGTICTHIQGMEVLLEDPFLPPLQHIGSGSAG